MVLGTSIKFWFNLQRIYNKKLLEIIRAKPIETRFI